MTTEKRAKNIIKKGERPFAAIYIRTNRPIDESSQTSKWDIITKHKVNKIFCDIGFSDIDSERATFENFMKDIESDRIHTLLVQEVSRFSRDKLQLEMFLNKINKKGIKLITAAK